MRATRSPRVLPVLLAAILGLSGCATGGAGGGTPRGSSTRIIPAELESVANLDLYSAINRLRPQWLRSGTRGSLPEVMVDGNRQPGGIDSLRSMRAADVGELQYLSASDATTRYGTGFTGGAIIVSSKR